MITRGVCNVWSGNPLRWERGRNFGNLDLLLRARALPEATFKLAGGCNFCRLRLVLFAMTGCN